MFAHDNSILLFLQQSNDFQRIGDSDAEVISHKKGSLNRNVVKRQPRKQSSADKRDNNDRMPEFSENSP